MANWTVHWRVHLGRVPLCNPIPGVLYLAELVGPGYCGRPLSLGLHYRSQNTYFDPCKLA